MTTTTKRIPKGTPVQYKSPTDGKWYDGIMGDPGHDSLGGEWLWIEFPKGCVAGTWVRPDEVRTVA